jgi:hypothetical protein
MNRLEHRIERDLRQIAGRATPSPDAWHSILTRISDLVLDDMPVAFTEEEEAAMIDLETHVSNEARPKGRMRIVAAVLAAAAVVAIALVASRDGDHRRKPSDQPSPTVTVPPTTLPSIEARMLFSVPGQPFEPGTYYMDGVNGTRTPRISATLDAGWWDVETSANWFMMKGGLPEHGGFGVMTISNPVAVYADACHASDGFYPGPVATVDEFVTALMAQQGGWVDVTEPSDIVVDGYIGKTFQRTAPAVMSDCTSWDGGPQTPGIAAFVSWASPQGSQMGYGPGLIETLWILDLDGTLVVINTELFAGPSATANAGFADAVLDAIRIDPS